MLAQLLVFFVGGAGVASGREAPPLPLQEKLETVLEEGLPSDLEELRLVQEQVRRVVELARAATVAVELEDSVGSGVVVSAEGLVLTAGHVSVEPNRAVTLRFADGTRVKALSLGVNHKIDSGLLRITDTPPSFEGKPGAWAFVPMAEEQPEPGDWVVGLGQPNGFVEGRDPPVRLGRVLTADRDTLNTDVTLVGGDSGGPLVSLQGEVVGIHSKIGEQITSNYHVPVAAYRREWKRLEAGRMAGVPDGEDPDDWRPLAGLALTERDGAPVVTQVFPDLPADEAGVVPGDTVLSFAGEEVASPEEVDRLIRQREPYERVPLLVRRGDVTVELTLWLGRSPTAFPGVLNREETR